MTDPLALSLIVIGMFAVFCWALACIFRDASIADLFWPLYHALATTTYLYLAPAEEASALAVIFYLLICLWASRLFLHLFFRRLGQQEDHRYAAIREEEPRTFLVAKLLYDIPDAICFGLADMRSIQPRDFKRPVFFRFARPRSILYGHRANV